MAVAEQVKSARSDATRRWAQLRRRRPGIDHVVRGYGHYKENHGDHLAAAITYFSFLALFPLILLAVSVTGFVLASRRQWQDELFAKVAKNVPGSFGTTVTDLIHTAVNQRAGVGVIGLLGVALAGLGWIANLRAAIDIVWGLPGRKRSFLVAKGADALVLAGLGVGLVFSLGITAGGTAASGYLLRLLNLDNVTGAGAFTSVLALALGILGSMVVFGWLMTRMPDVAVPRRTALKASLLAAVGFEILKVVGTYYIARVTKSPAGAVLGPIVGILVWIDLVARYLLFCVAWAATANRPAVTAVAADGEPPVAAARGGSGRPAQRVTGAPPVPSPVGMALGLISAGAAVGAGALAWWQRRDRQPQER